MPLARARLRDRCMTRKLTNDASALLTKAQKVLLLVGALAIILLVALYVDSPPKTSVTEVERDAKHRVVKTVQRDTAQRGDAIVVAGLGFALVLALMVLFDGRVKVTGPGGAGIELVATAAAADAAISQLTNENEELRESVAKLEGGQALPADPALREALDRWKDVEQRIRERR